MTNVLHCACHTTCMRWASACTMPMDEAPVLHTHRLSLHNGASNSGHHHNLHGPYRAPRWPIYTPVFLLMRFPLSPPGAGVVMGARTDVAGYPDKVAGCIQAAQDSRKEPHE